MMQLRKIVNEAEVPPKFYGRAYVDFACNRAICYPIPLNILVGIVHSVGGRLKRGVKPDWFSEALAQARRDGYAQGYGDAMLEAGMMIEAAVEEAKGENGV